jgi:hypothetical protein
MVWLHHVLATVVWLVILSYANRPLHLLLFLCLTISTYFMFLFSLLSISAMLEGLAHTGQVHYY